MAVLTLSFYSLALRRTAPVNVIIPSDVYTADRRAYAPSAPFPTLYLLHGIAASHVDWLNRSRVAGWAQEAGVCVVMPAGNSKFYCDSDISGDYYGRFLTEDLIAFVENTFRVSRRREDRFIAGLSMGGYGALANGLRHPELYSRIAAFSSALIKETILHSDEKGTGGFYTRRQFATLFGLEDAADFEGSCHDCDALARAVVRSGAPRPELYLCCGRQDGLMPANRAFSALLSSLGYEHLWQEWDGAHDWIFWDEAVHRALCWLTGRPMA